MNSTKLASLPRKFFSHKKTLSSQVIHRKNYNCIGSVESVMEDESSFMNCLNKAFNCVALKSLPHKRQTFAVISNNLNNYIVRTRFSHTMEVVAIAIRIASLLGLNVTLTHAIALLHDTGHLPYGHLGEQEFGDFTKKTMCHNIIATVLLQEVENFGQGLNLSKQVLEGIFYHSVGEGEVASIKELSYEYMVVRFADKIAYMFADANDARRINGSLPEDLSLLVNDFGKNRQERIETCIEALAFESYEKGYVDLSGSTIGLRFQILKDQLYQKIYKHADKDEDRGLLSTVLEFLKNNENLLPINHELFFSLMIDSDCEALYDVISRANKKEIVTCLSGMTATEIGKNLPEDFSSPDLETPVLL